MATATLSVSIGTHPKLKYVTIGTPDISTTAGLCYGLSLSASDLIVYSQYALKNGATTSYSISVSTNGNFVVEAQGDSSSMSFLYFIWDETTNDYGLTGTYAINAGTSISSTIAVSAALVTVGITTAALATAAISGV